MHVLVTFVAFKEHREFMTRKTFMLSVCAAIFLSLMLASAGAVEEELPGLDVYVLGQHAYVAGLGFGLGVFDVIDRSRLHTNGHFLVQPDR